MTTIPLLKLPILVITNILESMGLIDRFLLAHVSQRMKRIVKNSSRVRNHRFLVFFNQRAGFRFQTMDRKTLPEDFIVEDDDAADMNYIEKLLRKPFKLSMSKTNRQILTIYWDDVFIGMKTICEEITELFSVPVNGVCFDLNGVDYHLESIINFTNSLDPRTESVRIDGEECDFDQYKYVLENIKSPNNLACHAEPKEHLEMGDISLKFEKIYIKSGQWVKLNHLKSIEANEIVIDHSNFTDQILNNLFRNLRGLLHSKTKKLDIYFYRHVDIDTVMDGFDADEDDESRWSFPMDNGKKFIVDFYDDRVPRFSILMDKKEDNQED
ncbi:unnamed protein product [Caenorhabditis brenneri]